MEKNKKDILDRHWYLLSYNSLDTRAIGGLRVARLSKFLKENKVSNNIVTRYSSKEEDISISYLLQHPVFRKPLTYLMAPDAFIFWSFKVYQKLKRKSGVILTSTPPHSLHLTGILLKKYSEKFYWIADFRDPWTLNDLDHSERWQFKTWFYKRKVNAFLEKRIAKYADLIILNTETDLKNYIGKYSGTEQKSIYIRNGFDQIIENEASRNDTKIRFVYSGSTYQGKALLAIDKVLDKLKKGGFDLECDYFGDQPIGIENCEHITNKGVIRASEVAHNLTKYHFGFAYLPPENLNGGRILQKFYDYLGSMVKPVVINPSFEMKQIMEDIDFGFILYEDSLEEKIWSSLKDALEQVPSTEKLSNYSRQHQFSRLINHIQSIGLSKKDTKEWAES